MATKRLLRAGIDSLTRNLAFRRWLAKPVTQLRQNPVSRAWMHRLASTEDPWAHNQTADPFAEQRKHYTVDFRKLLPDAPLPNAIGLIALKNDAVVAPFFQACSMLGLKGVLFDPTEAGFIDTVRLDTACSLLLCRPSHITTNIRQMFREKVTAIADLPKHRVFPGKAEQQIYEAKRELAYFLQAHDIPHPATHIFYDRDAALAFAARATYPLVFKTHNGAGASGVEILYTAAQAQRFIREIFDRHYINKFLTDYRDIDYGYILLQEFVEDAREFRLIKIGDSWMGHEKDKLDTQEFMSGSGVNKWTPPPPALLDFCERLAEQHGFTFMAFDIFQDKQGNYLVNELQTWFGSYNPSQMYIDNVPCRYRKVEGHWVTEPGFYNDVSSLPMILVSVLNASHTKPQMDLSHQH